MAPAIFSMAVGRQGATQRAATARRAADRRIEISATSGQPGKTGTYTRTHHAPNAIRGISNVVRSLIGVRHES